MPRICSLESGTEVCGIRYSWNYFAAANLFPRDAEPVLEQIDEHTTRLRLGGEITYMGKYSYIEYTDGAATTLVVSDETLMTFYIENGVIAAVSWMAPEESMRLPGHGGMGAAAHDDRPEPSDG